MAAAAATPGKQDHEVPAGIASDGPTRDPDTRRATSVGFSLKAEILVPTPFRPFTL
ncbi:MAG: hypothetical protein ACK57E_04825 [Erythrobacteraceae bacterium]|jgi:hypothetical protein